MKRQRKSYLLSKTVGRALKIRVKLRRLALSRSAVEALRHGERYDFIAFTSKHARTFFREALQEYGIKTPNTPVLVVGPRNNLLAFDIDNKRILFPRSAIAPADILKRLRKRGAIVRTIRLYTVQRVPLLPSLKKQLAQGEISEIQFRSPSGVVGFLRQLRGAVKKRALAIRAQCIGETTAQAARQAGFTQVTITNI